MTPEIPTYGERRFASVRAALEDGPKRFEQLIAAIATRDGRDVVRDLEAVRATHALDRDELGRYVLGAASADVSR